MKKNNKILLNLILIVSLVTGLVGCATKEEEALSDFFIYYVDEAQTKITSEPYVLKETTLNKQIMELITQLETDSTDVNNHSGIPGDVTVNGFDYSDGMIVVDFAEDYKYIDRQREVLCRACVVITLCQLEEVEYVAFTINDEPYMSDGENILGAMKATDFVFDTKEVSNSVLKKDFILYFASADGSQLQALTLEAAQYGDNTMERFIVEQLIKGPQKEGYLPTLSSKVVVNSVVTANGICYVDFGKNFLTENTNVSAELVIYSLVNSLSELTDIQKVQISVNGETNIKYRENISLNDPFMRDLDLIKTD